MKTWREAVDLIESIDPVRDTNVLKAARILAATVRKLMHRTRRSITANGTTLTLSEWALRTGISEAAIYRRLQAGWSEADAATIPNQADGSKFAGKTLEQHASDSGIGKSCIYARLKRGWSIEAAVTTPLVKPTRKRT